MISYALQGLSERATDSAVDAWLLPVKLLHSRDRLHVLPVTSVLSSKIKSIRRSSKNISRYPDRLCIMWKRNIKMWCSWSSWILLHQRSRMVEKARSGGLSPEPEDLPLQIWQQMARWSHHFTLVQRLFLSVRSHPVEYICSIVQAFSIKKRSRRSSS